MPLSGHTNRVSRLSAGDAELNDAPLGGPPTVRTDGHRGGAVIRPPCGTGRAGAGALRPRVEPVAPVLQGGARFGDLRVLHEGLRVAMIGVDTQRDEEVANDVLLLRPAGGQGLDPS